jgi:hypothetical protein
VSKVQVKTSQTVNSHHVSIESKNVKCYNLIQESFNYCITYLTLTGQKSREMNTFECKTKEVIEG